MEERPVWQALRSLQDAQDLVAASLLTERRATTVVGPSGKGWWVAGVSLQFILSALGTAGLSPHFTYSCPQVQSDSLIPKAGLGGTVQGWSLPSWVLTQSKASVLGADKMDITAPWELNCGCLTWSYEPPL